MRYYKQFHGWSFLYLIALAFSLVSFYLGYAWATPEAWVISLACGIAGLVVAWILKKGRKHYLDIDAERITHRGFKQWTLRKSQVTRVEQGKKGLLEEYETFLKIYVGDEEYTIDGGFFPNEERLNELVAAIQSGTSRRFV
jgi:hypothetical protein